MFRYRLTLGVLALIGSLLRPSPARAAEIGLTLTEVDSLTLTSSPGLAPHKLPGFSAPDPKLTRAG